MRGGGSRTPDLLKVHPAPPKSHNNDATHNDTKISQINTIINNIWEQYDTDKNGILDSEEFSVLVSDTMHNRGMGAASPTEEEVEELLLMVDNDGDMVITQDEFFSMIHGLMMMDSTERVEMAELSTSFCKLMIFVESLTNEMMDNEEKANGVEADQEDSQKDQENNQEDQE
jgi:Ca2+-binding EF-hand superfamily protein